MIRSEFCDMHMLRQSFSLLWFQTITLKTANLGVAETLTVLQVRGTDGQIMSHLIWICTVCKGVCFDL